MSYLELKGVEKVFGDLVTIKSDVGNPILRQKGAAIDKITSEIKQLIADMFDTMRVAHGAGLAVTVARAPSPQGGASAGFVQVKLLTGVNPVRIADVIQIHAPQLGPTPRAGQEQRGDVPQGVTALDGVLVGRIGRQIGQRHPALRDLLRGSALTRRDGKILGQHRRVGGDASQHQQCGPGLAHGPSPPSGRGGGHHRVLAVFMHLRAATVGRAQGSRKS